MATLQEVGHLLAGLSRAEKAQVLQWVVRDLGDAYSGIESRADVNGGEACIVRTRIPVWLLVHARQLGASEAELLHSYCPSVQKTSQMPGPTSAATAARLSSRWQRTTQPERWYEMVKENFCSSTVQDKALGAMHCSAYAL